MHTAEDWVIVSPTVPNWKPCSPKNMAVLVEKTTWPMALRTGNTEKHRERMSSSSRVLNVT